jgi:hypothetical protein
MGSPEIDASRGGGNVCEVNEDASAQNVGETGSKRPPKTSIVLYSPPIKTLKTSDCS